MSMKVFQITSRQKKIVKILLRENGWVKGSDIAKETDTTVRTVRSDVAAINTAIFDHKFLIESSRQYGYRLQTNDMELLNQILFDETDIPNTSDERIRYLSIKLLQADVSHPVDIQKLEEELFVGEATLEHDINKIKNILKNRKELFLVQRKSGKIWTEGTEESRRYLLKDLIIDKSNPDYLMLNNYRKFFSGSLLDECVDCLMESLSLNEKKMSDEDILRTSIYLAIKIWRLNQGCILDNIRENQLIPSKEAEEVGTSIANILERDKNFVIPIIERESLIHQLSLVKVSSIKDENIENKTETESYKYFLAIIDVFLQEIFMNFGINLTKDEELRAGLTMHITYIVKNRKRVSKNSSPILQYLKTEYPYVFDMSLYMNHCFQDLFNIELTEDDFGYITAHLGAAIERQENSRNIEEMTVALISNNKQSANAFLVSRIKSEFEGRFKLIGPYSIYSIQEVEKICPM